MWSDLDSENITLKLNCNEAEIFDFLPDRHLRVADKLGLTIVLHMSRRDRLKDKKNVNALMEIEQKYPNIKLIVAHVGRAYSLEEIGDAFSTLKTSKNILFDFSANTLSDAIKNAQKKIEGNRGHYLQVQITRQLRS